MRQSDDALLGTAGRHNGERGSLGVKPRGRLEQVVEIAGGYQFIVGRLFQSNDISDRLDSPGKSGRPWHGHRSLPLAEVI